MIHIFNSVKHLTNFNKLCIDNNIFRFHYKCTTFLLIVLSLIVTSRQYIGDPIACIVDKIPPNVMNTYCWIYSTYTINDKLTGTVGKDVAHPGVGTHIQDEDQIKYYKYYQWVCFMLAFQAMFFYIPHYLWKNWENGRTKYLVLGLNDPIVSEDVKKDRKGVILKYFENSDKCHNIFFYKYLICEVLNFVNVLGQLYFVDFFLDGDFLSYGHKVLKYDGGDVDDPMENPMTKVFPKITKCVFHKYGPSGSIQSFDGLCILPINILNEKIYAIIWFWFVILIILSGLMLIYRCLIIFSRCTRGMALNFNNKYVTKKAAHTVVNNLNVGDWFLLMLLKKNIDSIIFGEIIEMLFKQFQVY